MDFFEILFGQQGNKAKNSTIKAEHHCYPNHKILYQRPAIKKLLLRPSEQNDYYLMYMMIQGEFYDVFVTVAPNFRTNEQTERPSNHLKSLVGSPSWFKPAMSNLCQPPINFSQSFSL